MFYQEALAFIAAAYRDGCPHIIRVISEIRRLCDETISSTVSISIEPAAINCFLDTFGEGTLLRDFVLSYSHNRLVPSLCGSLPDRPIELRLEPVTIAMALFDYTGGSND